MNSPLQLNRLYFTRVHVDAIAEQVVTAQITTSAALNVKINHAHPRNVGLKLEVRFGPAESSPAVFSGEIIAVGEFEVHPQVAVETAQKLAVVNGASILFGAIREMVTNITARSAIGVPLILATMSFTDIADQALKSIAEKRALQESGKAPEAEKPSS